MRLRPFDVRIAYRAILRREPSHEEVQKAALTTNLKSSRFHFYRDMIDSEEFRKQILPALIASSVNAKTTGVFFLHVPKTGGTSLRELIGDLIGVPSINVYGKWPIPNLNTHGFWPYWAGHAQVSFFPESHKGITFFRETKSLVMSRYRQQQNLLLTDSTHGWNFSGPEAPKRKNFPDFNQWLLSKYEQGALGLAMWLALENGQHRQHKTQEELIKISNMSNDALEPLLVRGLSRLSAAARIEDEDGVKMAIQKATGFSPDALPRKNTFESKSGDKSIQLINRKSMEILEEVEQQDELVNDLARDMDVLHETLALNKSSIFQKNLGRLGFEVGSRKS